jgi:hypothetical protein
VEKDAASLQAEHKELFATANARELSTKVCLHLQYHHHHRLDYITTERLVLHYHRLLRDASIDNYMTDEEQEEGQEQDLSSAAPQAEERH